MTLQAALVADRTDDYEARLKELTGRVNSLQPAPAGVIYYEVFFVFNSDVLSSSSWTYLDALARAGLTSNVRVIGFADERGTDGYNLALSKKRAQNVAIYLRAKGVSVLSVDGIGRTSDFGVGGERNRRVLIEVQPRSSFMG